MQEHMVKQIAKRMKSTLLSSIWFETNIKRYMTKVNCKH